MALSDLCIYEKKIPSSSGQTAFKNECASYEL